jgi:bacterioferritin (cytochrome b1)
VRNRITRGGAVRRALLAAAAIAVAAVALAACGGGGGAGGGGEGTSAAAKEREADVALLNRVLSRQLGVVAAYERVMHGLGGFDLAAARRFQAQEQEHVDALVKAVRGLGGAVEAEPEEIDVPRLKQRADLVEFLYVMESATIDSELAAIAKLHAPWPRSLLASTVADQAQHLVILRRELGAKPLEAIPEPFENGTTPAP